MNLWKNVYMLWPVWTFDPGDTFLSRLVTFNRLKKSGNMGWIDLDPEQFLFSFRRWFSEIDPSRDKIFVPGSAT
jgi:hypothetical protein